MADCLIRARIELMKNTRLVYSPTRNRRLNEMLGLVVLVCAGLLLLALLTYTASDPSLNSIGGSAGMRPAHNWTGLLGAFIADLLLQSVGVAALFLPLVLLRLGISWMRSRAFGSLFAKSSGVALWMIFAPAAIALLPGDMRWRHALPVAGVEGRILAEALIRLLNFPGATILCGLMVALSLYLTTSFTLTTAGEWFASHFGFLSAVTNRLSGWKRRRSDAAADDVIAAYESKRERRVEKARRRAMATAEVDGEPLPGQRMEEAPAEASQSLLSGLFGWFGRRQASKDSLSIVPHEDRAAFVPEAISVWDNIPRTQTEPVTAEGPVAPVAAAVPVSAEPAFLRGVAAPRLPFEELLAEAALEEDWLNAPERKAPAPILSRADSTARPPAPEKDLPPMPSPTQDIRAQNIAFGKRADADLRSVAIAPKSIRGYKLPPSSLLYRSAEQAVVREDALRDEARTLVEKCAEFGVAGSVEQINPGPVVTTFEFRPDAGVKYSRVTGLADDLCLAMAAESILIERTAGKSTVGIQVPNHERETIWLRDVVECESFAQSKSRLPVALGKDISGRIVTGDLAAMPHVLIAGSTGSGKSVAINAMIMSVLFKSTPEQVRMILVDPKRVELGMYEGIPHLFTPIITEAKLAANALRNAVREMERRLKLLAANHVRNIDQFNKLFENGSEYLFEDVNQEPLPYIMIIIDELADLMMLDRSNVEEAITRLAQMARAVGIHLVLATQRPSVDVITGLIKANVPTRMSFRLATKVDSRTIIDSNGAESLLGRGDMLFLPPGTSRLQRVHAPFVTEKEIAAVTEFWRAQGQAEYVEGFLEVPKEDRSDSGGGSGTEEENDPMFDDAVRLVFEFGKASTSLLQRRLRIGYGRAAHLIDLMERDGLVGPADGSKPREILKSPSYFSEMDAALR
jgi:S-DNA-T family DNA segregation ATPase FtsK/SpoIIIE